MEPIHAILGAILEAIAMYIAFRKKLAEANKAVAEKDRTIAEKDRTIAERDRTIAERNRCIAETELLGVNAAKAKTELRIGQFLVQDKLTEENQKYKDAQQSLVNALITLTDECSQNRDASSSRDSTVRILAHNVIDTFSSYVEKAVLEYSDQSAVIIASFLRSEVVPFLGEVIAFRNTLNDEDVLSFCANSCAPFVVTNASLGTIERAFISLFPRLPEELKAAVVKSFIDEGIAGNFINIDKIMGI